MEDSILDYLATKGEISVEQLYEGLQGGNLSPTERQITDLVLRLAAEGKVDLKAAKSSETLVRFLWKWELNLCFYVSAVASFGAILAIYLVPSEFPIVVVRWVFGAVFILFIPGFAAVEALFGIRDLDSVERVALSFGLSLALATLVGAILNYTPWGMTLTPIVISLTLTTMALNVIALLRKHALT